MNDLAMSCSDGTVVSYGSFETVHLKMIREYTTVTWYALMRGYGRWNGRGIQVIVKAAMEIALARGTIEPGRLVTLIHGSRFGGL